MRRTVTADEIEDVFASDGKLDKAFDVYESRPTQAEFSVQVAEAVAGGKSAMLEAGTGMGKTYGYLVPLLLSGMRAQISTSTRNLQEQLVKRDIPNLLKALDMSADVRMLKGRANYICKERLGLANEQNVIGELFPKDKGSLKRDLDKVSSYAIRSMDGDISAIDKVSRKSHIWPIVTSTRKNCTGSLCAHYADCFFYSAVKAAKRADIVVSNHALTLYDAVYGRDLMGRFDAILFDEAHEIVENLPHYFARTISLSEHRNIFSEAGKKTAILLDKKLDEQLDELLESLERLVQQILICRKKFEDGSPRQRIPRPMLSEDVLLDDGYKSCLDNLKTCLKLLADIASERGEEQAVQLKSIAEIMLSDLDLWHQAGEDVFVWLEVAKNQVTYWRVPYHIAALFHKHVLSQQPTLLVSSTLAINHSLNYASMLLGMDEAQKGIWESPFDYDNNSLVWLPPDLPHPSKDQNGHVKEMVKIAIELIEANRGKACLLFVTLSSMKAAEKLLRTELAKDYELLVQNEADASKLVEKFSKDDGIPKVLVGSRTFSQGVDLPGRTLSLLFIDKIPFTPPDDPIQYMRASQLDEAQNEFTILSVPRAAMRLKQASGRLIRSATDKGVLVLCDPRLASTGYGELILQSLQPMRRANSKQEILKFIEGQI